jgi:hypothetical protein
MVFASALGTAGIYRRTRRERHDDSPLRLLFRHLVGSATERPAAPAKANKDRCDGHRRLRLAADASAMLLEGLKVVAWYFLSPDMFRNEAAGTRLGFRFSLNSRPTALG